MDFHWPLHGLYMASTWLQHSLYWKFWLKKFWWMQMTKKLWCHPPKCWRGFFLKNFWDSPPFIFIKFLLKIYHFLINPPQLLFWGGFALLFIYSDFGLILWKFWLQKNWWMQIAKELWCHPPKCWRDFFKNIFGTALHSFLLNFL